MNTASPDEFKNLSFGCLMEMVENAQERANGITEIPERLTRALEQIREFMRSKIQEQCAGNPQEKTPDLYELFPQQNVMQKVVFAVAVVNRTIRSLVTKQGKRQRFWLKYEALLHPRTWN